MDPLPTFEFILENSHFESVSLMGKFNNKFQEVPLALNVHYHMPAFSWKS